MIFHDRRLLFIHIPKTGGTTLRKLLKTIPVPPPLDELGMHFSVEKAIARYPEHEVRSYTVVTTKRNPWDRLASLYVQNRRAFDLGRTRARTPEDYVKFHETAPVDEPLRKLSLGGALPPNLDLLDFEHLERDIRTLFRTRFDHELAEFPHLHSKEDSYYELQRTIVADPAYRAVIAERCREEIELFGYEDRPPS